jgi:membrane-associated HD superfamily phosphohydrolase
VILGRDPIVLALMALAGVAVLVGLFISYQAYRGLRRNDSRQMLYLSVGMILLFGVAYGLAFLTSAFLQFRLLPLVYQDALRLAVRVVQVAGLACIAYSMYIDA